MKNHSLKKRYSYPAVDELVFCGFFNKETGKCSVHPVKPETCRAGPVTFDINFSTKKVEWFLKKPKSALSQEYYTPTKLLSRTILR